MCTRLRWLLVALAAAWPLACREARAPRATQARGPRSEPMTSDPARFRGVLLEDLTWVEAEKRLGPDTVVVIPLGAAAKEHGPHLRLDNDLRIAEHMKRRVLERADVVVAPTVGYHHYPPFVEYPGSVSLRLSTARDLIVDIVRSLARFGPRRFYVLNTGISTVRALQPAAELLAADGILLRYTDLHEVMGETRKRVSRQAGGSHADEVETSMMLYLAPDRVDMSKAVRDLNPDRPGGLTRRPDGPGVYSPTGIWGDPTLATREKGELLVDAYVAGLLRDIEELRRAALPSR